ncbi:hypothetical protein M0805_005710 [Coniferiporia weirii]|nr:hypothetical protein M0805_005710 [Coniferiporia weirii]
MDRNTSSIHQGSPSTSTVHPKPPTPLLVMQVEDDSVIPNVPAVIDPPPPYPARERRTRGERARVRRAVQSSGASVAGTLSASSSNAHVHGMSDDSSPYLQEEHAPLYPTEDGTETTPLLLPRRRRTLSHSTAVSAHSIAHTVFSLFEPDDVDAGEEEDQEVAREEDGLQDTISAATASRRSVRRYFRPLWRGTYYRPLAHLLFINFFYALLAFLYLFAGTLTGTTLLIALPLGAVLCWLNLAGARAFARGEIALQTFFHGPLPTQSPAPPYPIFNRPSATPSTIEAGQPTPQNRPSFLRNTYAMFTDQTSYQAIFYFLVIKPSITLFLTIALLVLVPVAFVLVVPAPAVLRAVKRIGIWQASIALEGLLRPRL